jgi:hypothetical protein
MVSFGVDVKVTQLTFVLEVQLSGTEPIVKKEPVRKFVFWSKPETTKT